jgi:hypothetical protein
MVRKRTIMLSCAGISISLAAAISLLSVNVQPDKGDTSVKSQPAITASDSNPRVLTAKGVDDAVELSQAPQAEDSATLSFAELLAAATSPHEVSPLSTVPSHFRFARGPLPDAKKWDRPMGPGYTQFNPWNHINSLGDASDPNARVKMGALYLALFIDDKWEVRNFGPPCVATEFQGNTKSGKAGDPAVRFGNKGTCQGGYAYAGLGMNGWNDPTHHTHGWSPSNFVEGDSAKIKYVLAWGAAKMEAIDPNKPYNPDAKIYQYGIGADKRNPTGSQLRLPAMTHGQSKIVTSNWRVFTASTMSPQTLTRMCQEGKLPAELPLKGGC